MNFDSVDATTTGLLLLLLFLGGGQWDGRRAGRRAGSAQRAGAAGYVLGGRVSGVGARVVVVVVQGLTVGRSVVCNFWNGGMQCSGKILDVGADGSPCVFRLSSSLLSVASGTR